MKSQTPREVAARFGSLPLATIVTDRDGTVVGWNDAATDLYGWSSSEAIGRSVGELTVPVGVAEQASAIMERVTAGEPWSGSFSALRKDGSTIEVHVVDAPLFDKNGDLAGILGVSAPTGRTDWRLLVEHATDAMSVHDSDGRYRYASPGFEQLLGLSSSSLIGSDPYERLHPDDLDDVRTAHEVALGGPFSVQYRIRRADGTYRWVATTGTAVPDQGSIVAVTRAIPQQRSMQQSLELERQLGKELVRLRQERTDFLTTVAHRARHPLTLIVGSLLLFDRMLESDPEHIVPTLRTLLPRLRANTDELSSLIEQVTSADVLSRRALRLRSRPVRLAALVHDVVGELASPDAPIDVDVPPDATVHADPAQLRLAMRAVLQNAVIHTPMGTQVWIDVEQDPEHLTLRVADAGHGVPDRLKEAIFEQFRRGRGNDDPDPGMGLGLHVVAEIVALHGGHVWVEDREGGGACFHLRLPTEARAEGAGRPIGVDGVLDAHE